MDTTNLLIHTVAALARRQFALETLLQKHGVSKEQIDAAASQAPNPTNHSEDVALGLPTQTQGDSKSSVLRHRI